MLKVNSMDFSAARSVVKPDPLRARPGPGFGSGNSDTKNRPVDTAPPPPKQDWGKGLLGGKWGDRLRRLGYPLIMAALGTGAVGTCIQDRAERTEMQQKNRQIATWIEEQARQVKQLEDGLRTKIPLHQLRKAIAVATGSAVRIDTANPVGSGVIVEDSRQKRYILTNNHITRGNGIRDAEGNETYRITLYDGDDFNDFPFVFDVKTARLANGDLAASPPGEHNLTLLEIPDSVKLPDHVRPARLRDLAKAPIKVGEPVIAIGNPLANLDIVSHGMVSHADRKSDLKSEENNVFLGFDAPISKGGSAGGGLFDAEGRLIGIVTAGKPESDGIGCAIRADVIQDLLKKWDIALSEGISP